MKQGAVAATEMRQTSNRDVAATINALRENFLDTLDERIYQIDTMWISACQDSANAGRAGQAVESELHRLAGIAGSLGFDEVGLCARDLEQAVAKAMQCEDSSMSLAKLNLRMNAFLDLLESHLPD